MAKGRSRDGRGSDLSKSMMYCEDVLGKGIFKGEGAMPPRKGMLFVMPGCYYNAWESTHAATSGKGYKGATGRVVRAV